MRPGSDLSSCGDEGGGGANDFGQGARQPQMVNLSSATNPTNLGFAQPGQPPAQSGAAGSSKTPALTAQETAEYKPYPPGGQLQFPCTRAAPSHLHPHPLSRRPLPPLPSPYPLSKLRSLCRHPSSKRGIGTPHTSPPWSSSRWVGLALAMGFSAGAATPTMTQRTR